MAKEQHWYNSRKISQRIIIEGNLELITPAHFGSGDHDGMADLALLRDPYEGLALLPGASIAGALRNYWREYKYGYAAPAMDNDLFGAKRGAKDEMEGSQSLLIIDDALGSQPQLELRQGVSIEGETRTAKEKNLYDIELLRVGTSFPLRFELLISDTLDETKQQQLVQDLALALTGFENQEIKLGARKYRGFGLCRVKHWQVKHYHLSNLNGLLAWLISERDWQNVPKPELSEGPSIVTLLKTDIADIQDKRHKVILTGDFKLDSSLLIRSGFGQADQGPDAVHLHRPHYTEPGQLGVEKREPILSGTSLAGSLRARALRIANTLANNAPKAKTVTNDMFGIGPENQDDDRHQASRLEVEEQVLENVHTLIQNRIQIDRFTGGAKDNHLFNEAPVYGNGHKAVTLDLMLRTPQNHEIGLLLFLLKDLWTADLPVGGESGIGRGRLHGLYAELTHQMAGQKSTWIIKQDDSGDLTVTSENIDSSKARHQLEEFAAALYEHLKEDQNGSTN